VRGFMKNELILIGADSGLGKSEMGLIIEENMAKQDNKVFLFSLESYVGEIEDRKKFGLLLPHALLKFNKHFYFKEWVTGQYPELLELEKELEIDERVLDNFYLRYRKLDESYTLSQFELDIDVLMSKHDPDVIIIDHLHFFTLNEDKNENKELTKIIRKIRDISLLNNIPIFVLAQLRKNKNSDSLIPDYTEFYGSSEIFKSATSIITLAPNYEIETCEYKYPTFFRICKDRFGQNANRFALGCCYDAKHRCYDNEYRVYKLNAKGTKVEFLDYDKKPYWAQSAKGVEDAKM
jgi:hypothetical protein